MTLQERLTGAGYITDGAHYELFQPGTGASIRVTLSPLGAARVSGFDGQMTWKWSADFTAGVDASLIASFLDAAETLGSTHDLRPRPHRTPPPPDHLGRWNRLRDHIREERAAQDQLAAEHAELEHDDQSERAYGRVEALDGLLATMDRLEGDR